MDLLDLIPIVPPTLPGERSPELKPAQRFVARAASTALPVISFVLVLCVGFARHIAVALVALPLASAALTFLLSRRVATPIAWARDPRRLRRVLFRWKRLRAAAPRVRDSFPRSRLTPSNRFAASMQRWARGSEQLAVVLAKTGT
jgi:hypothetical protein